MIVRLALLLTAMLGAPQLVWLDRGQKIARLGKEYARQSPSGPSVNWGACTMAFLGYSLAEKIKKDPGTPEAAWMVASNSVADALAEVSSLNHAGAAFIRVGASGDQLLTPKPWQEAVDDRYMAEVKRTGRELVLVDTQHPQVCRNRKLSWKEFADWHMRRVEYYQQRYDPAVYIIVCEPMSYHGFVLEKAEAYSAEAWTKQLTAVARRVKELNPRTQTGICLLVMENKKPEWEVWRQMRTVPELDMLSVEIYQPEDFALTERRLEEFGHPRDFGKSFWISETYNGWALASDRRWEDDAQWLRITSGFARKTGAEAVLVWSFGTFLEGGSFFEFFRGGRMAERWAAAHRLSLVGRTFAELAAGERQRTKSPP